MSSTSPSFFGLLGPHLLAGQHQIQRLGHPDEARQTLGAAGSPAAGRAALPAAPARF